MKLILCLFFLLLPVFARAAGPPADTALDYTLDVSFDLEASLVRGVARIPLSGGQELRVDRRGLKLSHVTLDTEELPISGGQETIVIRPPRSGMIEIRYEGVFGATPRLGRDPVSDTIGEEGVFLAGTWYPKPDRLCTYRLIARFPKGFEAVSEAETIEKTTGDFGTVFSFGFPHPVDGINLIATDHYTVERDHFEGVEIVAYFFPEDADLIRTYIEKTKHYLRLYTAMIGKFPYKRFSIVENFLPTGYSMPTYTLLGKQVVRLPFIPQTSLGHEILHQWFGNLVYIDFEKGNWAEGLTSFLADHLYEEEKGLGSDYRKNALIGYMSYVNDKNESALKDFRVRDDQASEAIGYGKALMVFQMLRSMVGDGGFNEALRYLVEETRFKRAAWTDIRRAFEKEYQADLGWFFRQWIDGKGLPELRLQKAEVQASGNTFEVSFDVLQGKTPMVLDVPVTLYSLEGKVNTVVRLSKEKQRYTLSVGGVPDRIVLDEDYLVARRLSVDEFPPVIARLLGDEKRLVVAPPPSKGPIYEEIVSTFRAKGDRVIEADRITHEEIKNHSLVILGAENPITLRLFGSVPDKGGFSVAVRTNPWNPWKVAGVFDGQSREEVEGAFQKIHRYGKHSTLVFDHGANVSKTVGESARGIIERVSKDFRKEPIAVDISALKTLPAVIDGVADKKIVYVGEAHDRFSHHVMQLEIIRELHRKGKKIAIAMEMFQIPFQTVLDDYIGGRIDEKAFLRGTEYFSRWRFDYSLYRPILLYAKSENIPVVALNQRQEIVDKVFRSGLQSLSEDERKSVPAGMDFSDQAYRERLRAVFHGHEKMQPDRFDFFYQAQVLWDETMAESIARFLEIRPDYQVVVLAGVGHLSHGSGIPKRTARRNGHSYAIILNDVDPEPGIADFVLSPGTIPGGASPLLMVQLKEGAGKVVVEGFPPHSVSAKAGMKAGDIILAIDSVAVRAVEDLKIDLLSRKKGDKVRVRVSRKGFLGTKELDLEVVLQ